MKSFNSFFLFLILTTSICFSQTTQQYIGGTSDDVCFGVHQKGGRTVYAGYTESMGAGGKDVLATRPGFFKTFGTAGNDIAKSVVTATAASGVGQDYVFVGSTDAGAGKDILVLKTDVSGNILWQKTFGGSGDEEALKVIERINSGIDTTYLITGYTTSFGSGGKDALVLALDPSGNIKFAKVYGTTGNDEATSAWDVATSAQTATFGTYAICGNTTGVGSTSDVFILMLDATGAIVKSKIFDSGLNDFAYDISTTSTITKQVYVTGSTERPGTLDKDILLFCYNFVGEFTMWSDRYGSNLNEEGYGLFTTTNGLTLAGYSEKNSGDKDAFIASTDFNGTLQNKKLFGACKEDILYGITMDNTSSYFQTAGISQSFTNGLNDWYYNTSDLTLTSSCNQNNFSPTTTSSVFPNTPPDFTSSTSSIAGTMTISAISLSESAVPYTVSNICTHPCSLPSNILLPSDPSKIDTIVCTSPTYTADATVSDPCAAYLWSTGATTPTITVSTSGLYKVTITGSTCTMKDSVNVIFPDASSNVYSKWYFGFQGGLDFTSGTSPSLITSSMMDATNGATSISDASGNTLFYSNGINVWDKTDNIMPNGTGLNGNPGYSESALAAPVPGASDKYYLFTNSSAGIQYSIIDMSLNGGNGDVSSKNNSLFATTSEKMAAVAESNGNFWIVGTNGNNIITFHVTSSGIAAGTNYASGADLTTVTKGNMKFSKDGTKLAIALPFPQNTIEVYDFDKTTGAISNHITLNEPLAYDIAFSPDNTKLYSTNQNGVELAQFDLSSGNTKTILSNVGSTYYNSVKVGPDGKIYVGLGKAADGYIGVINNPNASGLASDYQHKLITMESGTFAQNGFPNTVANLSSKPDFSYQDTCYTNTTKFSGSATGNPSSWSWDFGDPATGANNTATGANPTHIYSSPNTTYTVKFTYTNSCGVNVTLSKNLFISPIPTVDIKDTLLCVTPYKMGATQPGATYLWSTGETTDTISITNAGKYWVKVTKNGCSNSDTAKVSVWGQGNKGDYNWMFGNSAGIKHSSSGQPSVNSTNALNTTGGSSSISDPSGNLLFYTDGVTVYNKNNSTMDGGTGLKGDPNSTQSALIVPDPRANNIYYVFTTSQTNGLNYSVVDLSYNNGLGKVIQLNIPMLSPSTEKLAGLKDDNGNFWVVGHKLNSNEFDAYKIDNAGVHSTPVSSLTGTSETDAEGYLKFSQDGTKAAVAIKGQNTVEVFDFNKTTGTFSNPVTITNLTTPTGVEFSSNNSKLYVSTNGNGNLYEYNLNAGNAAAVMATKTTISNDASQSYEDLQMGPDGRIYIAHGNGSTYLSVINNPDDSLDVGYQNKIINLTKPSNGELPDFIANYFKSSDWGIFVSDTCEGMMTTFTGSAPDSVRTWTWMIDNTITKTGQVITANLSPGTHNVVLTAVYHCGIKILNKTVTINPSPIPTLSDQTLCTANSYTLDAGNPGSTYIWTNLTTGQLMPNTGTGQQQTVTATGTYNVIVTLGSCSISDTAQITFAHVGSFDLGRDTTLCSGTTLTLDPGAFPGGTYNWSTGSHNQSIPVSSSGKYKLDILLASCTIKDSINVTFVTPPTVNLGPDFSLCLGSSKRIGANNAGASYIWSTNANSDSINVSSAGKYWLTVSKGGGCRVTDTVNVSVVTPPSVNLGPDQTYCSGAAITLDSHNPSLTTDWSTGTTAPTISVASSGIYWADVINGPCKVRDSIQLTFIVPPTISLGPDQTVCTGTTVTLDAGIHSGFTTQWSNNAITNQISPTASGSYWVHVFQGNCMKGDTVNVTFQDGPSIHLPFEIIICSDNGDTAVLNGGIASSYLWKPNMETSQSLVVKAAGLYTLEAKDALGCLSTATTNVLDLCEAKIYVPNIFSPNKDGKNDEFKIEGSNIKTFHLEIFDRWGELIYVSNDINVSWDGMYRGQIVEEGAYIWKINYSGETTKGIESHTKTGDVTVIK